MKTMVFTFLIIFCCGAAFAGSFTDNNNGTITDNVTGLTWQKCTNGLSGANCETGTATTYTWYEATAPTNVCGSLDLNGTGWRLPNIKELASLVDTTATTAPLIDSHFPKDHLPAFFYWSSTSYAADATAAWYVNFSGDMYYDFKSGVYYVRCVR